MFRILLLTLFCLLTYAQSSSSAVPTYAPIPATGFGPDIPTTSGYRIESFGDGLCMITDGLYHSMFLVGTESVIAVDAPPAMGHNILRAIRDVTDLPISHLVYSHAHADHIGAAYLLVNDSNNTMIVAHEETLKALSSARDGNNRPIPHITFRDEYQLRVNNQTLELSYKGSNHSLGNIFIYSPHHQVLIIVDLIYPGWIPYARLADAQNVPGWIRAHDQILAYDFKYHVGGHLNRYGTREDVQIQKEYIADLYNNCAEADRLGQLPYNTTTSAASTADDNSCSCNHHGSTKNQNRNQTSNSTTSPNPLSNASLIPFISSANPSNYWAIENYLDSSKIEWCANKTNAKWLGRLAAADVYGTSNAETMLESLRIDYGMMSIR